MSEGRKRELAAKYDSMGAAYSSSRYASPELVAGFFVGLVRSWGPRIPAGSSVLELGCGDGFMTEALVRAGLEVTAIDLSDGMIKAASRRLASAGLSADLRVGDIDDLTLDGRWDVVLGAMWTFFAYAYDPAATLGRLHAACRTKLIVDVDPRGYTVDRAIETVSAVGFSRPDRRPVTVPQNVRLGPAGSRAFEVALRIPSVRTAVLKRKLNVAVLGVR